VLGLLPTAVCWLHIELCCYRFPYIRSILSGLTSIYSTKNWCILRLLLDWCNVVVVWFQRRVLLILLLDVSCIVYYPCMQTMVLVVLDLCCVVRWSLFCWYVLEVFILCVCAVTIFPCTLCRCVCLHCLIEMYWKIIWICS
jgi:hypothetical protein